MGCLCLMAAENARAQGGQAPSACRPTDRDLRRCMASDVTTTISQASTSKGCIKGFKADGMHWLVNKSTVLCCRVTGRACADVHLCRACR